MASTTRGRSTRRSTSPSRAKTTAVAVPANPYAELQQIKASQSFQAFQEGFESIGVGPDRQENFERLLHKFTASSTWVYVAVTRISQSLAQIPLQIIQKDRLGTPDAVLRDQNPARGLRSLLQNPNPWQSRYDFMEGLGVSLELTGNAFIEKAEMVGSRPKELYVLDPSAMTIVPDRRKRVKKYILTVNARRIEYQPEEIIHVRYPNPMNQHWGLSPLTAARIAIDIDRGALEWNQNFMNRGGWPAGTITSEATPAKDEIRRIRSEIRAYANSGKRGAARILFLTGGLKYSAIAVTPKDMDWLSARRFSRDEILAIYNVPFAIAGLFSTEQTTARSAGVREQIRNFYRFNILPKMDGKVLGALNRELVPAFSTNLIIRADVRGVPVLQEDLQQDLLRSQVFRNLVSAGWSVNMALAEVYPHVPRVPWGDVWWANSAMVPIEGPENPVAAGGGDEPDDPDPAAEGRSVAQRLGINGGAEAAIERLWLRVAAGEIEPEDAEAITADIVADQPT